MSKDSKRAALAGASTVGGRVWAFRRELAVPAAMATAGIAAGTVLPGWASFAATAVLTGPVVLVPAARRAVAGWVGRGRLRRRMLKGLEATQVHALSGRLPRIRRLKAVPTGVRVTLVLPAGMSGRQVELRLNELATATRARVVRLIKDDTTAHRIDLDVVTRNPLAEAGLVAWADRDADVLSMWDPIHLGLGEDGRPVWLSLVERHLLIAGLPGAGKSSLLQVIVAHAALSPDAALVLIDPSEVQLSPWRDRAWLYAGADMDAALTVVEQVHAEMSRRIDWVKTRPGGVTRKVTRDTGLPLLVLVIDELAYHLSVAGSGQDRARYNALVRDLVARGRAFGIIAVVATQRPTEQVVPNTLSGLFGLRACGRVAETEDSDRVLGKGTAKAGWDASQIGLAERGVLLTTSEDAPAQRIKGAWIDDATIAELSLTTVRHRPANPTTNQTPVPAWGDAKTLPRDGR